jgi:hypothetical protein
MSAVIGSAYILPANILTKLYLRFCPEPIESSSSPGLLKSIREICRMAAKNPHVLVESLDSLAAQLV